MLNLDTHIVVFAFDDKLDASEREIMQDEDWAISSIALWELAFLVGRRRINLNLDGYRFESFLSQLEILPIDINVARTSARLDFRSDPADELIALTSIVYGIPLAMRDRVIRNSKLVPLST